MYDRVFVDVSATELNCFCNTAGEKLRQIANGISTTLAQ